MSGYIIDIEPNFIARRFIDEFCCAKIDDPRNSKYNIETIIDLEEHLELKGFANLKWFEEYKRPSGPNGEYTDAYLFSVSTSLPNIFNLYKNIRSMCTEAEKEFLFRVRYELGGKIGAIATGKNFDKKFSIDWARVFDYSAEKYFAENGIEYNSDNEEEFEELVAENLIDIENYISAYKKSFPENFLIMCSREYFGWGGKSSDALIHKALSEFIEEPSDWLK